MSYLHYMYRQEKQFCREGKCSEKMFKGCEGKNDGGM